MESYKPEAVLILGDTNSTLSANSAKRKKIPVFHMEAGNRCFDQRVPEELNRRIIDHISDINLPYSDLARENLLQEGLQSDRIIKTGSPMFEVLDHYSHKIDSSDILNQLNLKEKEYFVLSCHREENVDSDDKLKKLESLLRILTEKYGKQIIFSVHPRTRKRIEETRLQVPSLVQLLKPLGLLDYVKLQKHSIAVISDSGTISEEASILNIPALNIRDAHERPEGMEEGAAIMVGLNVERIEQALEVLEAQSTEKKRLFPIVKDYNIPVVSEKVVRIILSYVDYVNNKVWFKTGQDDR